MMNVLQAIGFGIVGFAVIVIIGLVVITKLGDSMAECNQGNYTVYNTTDRLCHNVTNVGNTSTPTGDSWVAGNYLNTQLGSSGLSGWIPAVIAVAIGGLFLAYFGGGFGKKKEY